MSDEKTERLINLTMALLATKRYLSKAEIFEQVAGYSGSTETKERMFERDKVDLRALGIEIEVGSHDPLFDDEPGYRISQRNYQLNLGDISPSEISYLSLAAALWRNQLFTKSGKGASVKIEALQDAGAVEDFGQGFLNLENETPLFPDLWEAITTHRRISFEYRSKDKTVRQVAPYGLSLWHGSWYLVGMDDSRSDIRVFKVSRITSSIEFISKPNSFEVPADFSIEEHLVMLKPEVLIQISAKVRVGRCQSLRNGAKVETIDAEWDRIHCALGSDWLSQILWFGPDIVIESPAEVIDEIRSALAAKL